LLVYYTPLPESHSGQRNGQKYEEENLFHRNLLHEASGPTE
jgi:hypothetical protein